MYNRFERALKEKGITRYRVSIETGIPQSILSRWKKGTATPKVDKLLIIADYLEIPLEELIKKEVKAG